MKDTSKLYTGATSSSFRSKKDEEIAQARADREKKATENKEKLKPYAEIISEEIQSELDDLNRMDTINVKEIIAGSQNPEETLAAILLGKEFARESIKQFQQRINNKIRERDGK